MQRITLVYEEDSILSESYDPEIHSPPSNRKQLNCPPIAEDEREEPTSQHFSRSPSEESENEEESDEEKKEQFLETNQILIEDKEVNQLREPEPIVLSVHWFDGPDEVIDDLPIAKRSKLFSFRPESPRETHETKNKEENEQENECEKFHFEASCDRILFDEEIEPFEERGEPSEDCPYPNYDEVLYDEGSTSSNSSLSEVEEVDEAYESFEDTNDESSDEAQEYYAYHEGSSDEARGEGPSTSGPEEQSDENYHQLVEEIEESSSSDVYEYYYNVQSEGSQSESSASEEESFGESRDEGQSERDEESSGVKEDDTEQEQMETQSEQDEESSDGKEEDTDEERFGDQIMYSDDNSEDTRGKEGQRDREPSEDRVIYSEDLSMENSSNQEDSETFQEGEDDRVLYSQEYENQSEGDCSSESAQTENNSEEESYEISDESHDEDKDQVGDEDDQRDREPFEDRVIYSEECSIESSNQEFDGNFAFQERESPNYFIRRFPKPQIEDQILYSEDPSEDVQENCGSIVLSF